VAFCWLDVNPFGPVQEYVTPGVVELPLTVVVGFEQVMVPAAVAVALGGVAVEVTVADAVLVQPLVELVTLSV
jgi:hypothetical protein